MEDVYLDGSRLVFVLLESLFVMASTKNIETLISRFHFSFTATSPCRYVQRQGTLRIRDNPYFYTMPVRRKIDNNSGIYFITFTCLDWLPIFEICKGYNSVYKWFDVLKNKAHYIVGYTIMPNHLHAIIAFRNTGKSINSIIANGKRFIAYELVYALKNFGNEKLLSQLAIARNNNEISSGKLYKVFETSFDWKWCNSEKMIEQKLSYIHSNPCKGKWDVACSPVEYLHSSAKYYLTGEERIYSVTNYKGIEDIDLHALVT